MKVRLLIIPVLALFNFFILKSSDFNTNKISINKVFLNKARGAVLGGAIGDAMGKPTEFLGTLNEIYLRYPNGIRSFNDFRREDFWQNGSGKKFAPYTDDTQMAKIVMEVAIESRINNYSLNKTMELLADEFIKWSNPANTLGRAPGMTCLKGVSELKRRKVAGRENFGELWWACGGGSENLINNEGGCGSVMRAWPLGLVWHDKPHIAEKFAVAQSLLTHRSPVAKAACAAMAAGTAHAFEGTGPELTMQVMIDVARKYDESTAQLMEWALEQAEKNTDSKIVFERLQAWSAHEAIAAALYIFAISHDDLKKAIHLGVHTSR